MLAFIYIEDHIKSVLKSTSAKNYLSSSKPVFVNTLSHFSKTISHLIQNRVYILHRYFSKYRHYSSSL